MPYHGDETDKTGLPSPPARPEKAKLDIRKNHPRKNHRRTRDYNYLRSVILLGISLLIILAPLVIGGRARWAWGYMGIAIAALFGVWVLRSWLRGKIEYWKSPIHIVFFLLLALTLLQILPLGKIVGILSPETALHWQEIEGAGVQASTHTISLLPMETRNCIFLILMALGLFFITTNSFTTRRSLFILPVAIISSATLNALIGIIEQFGDGKKSFWYLGISPYTVTGTFTNKNQFAMLLEMGLLVALGLAMAALFAITQRVKERDSGRTLLRKHQAFFSLIPILSTMAMLIALLFSFSRAGTLCAFLAIVAFSILTFRYSGRSLRLTGILASIAVVLTIASTRGLDFVWSRFEALASGESMSSAVRWDLWNTSLSLISRHWLTGVGFASYRYTSPQFESGPVPDTIAFYAHNDWLEFFCEFGIPAALVLLAISFFAIYKIALRLHHRHDLISKYIGMGALFALLSVAGHELFDYGLRMHGNMLIFICTVSLATICSHIPGNDELKSGPELRSLKLTPASSRAFLVVGMGMTIAFILAILPGTLAGTPLAHLTARVSPFARHNFEDPKKEAEYRLELSNQILSYSPDNIQALMQRAENNGILGTIELQTEQAKILNIPLEDLYNQDSYEEDTFSLEKLPQPLRDKIGRRFTSSVEDLRRACSLAPTNGHYFGLYARALEREGIFNNNLDEDKLQKAFELAHKSYPKISQVTILCAKGSWRKFLRMGEAEEKGRFISFNQALDNFAEAIKQNPYSAKEIYDTIYLIHPKIEVLRSITSPRLLSREIFYRYLFNLRNFDACIKELSIIKLVNEKRSALEKAETSDTYEFFRRDWRSKDEVALSVQKREILLLGLTERWDERSKRLASLRETLRPTLNEDLLLAEEFIAQDRLHQAKVQLKKILEKEPLHPQAIITQARVSQLLGNNKDAILTLLPLVYTDENIEAETLKQALEFATNQDLSKSYSSSRRFPVRNFLQAALMIKLNRFDEGLAELNNLIQRLDNKEFSIWIQGHLLHFFAAQALENLDQPQAALQEYARALALCPRHLPSARSSARLIKSLRLPEDPEDAKNSGGLQQALQATLPWLETINPEIRLNIDFGGKFRLLGYTITPRVISPADIFEIKFYWYCEGDIENEYSIGCSYSQGKEWAFTDSHYIRGIGLEMVGWRVGEVIEISRKVSPSFLATKQNRPGLKQGLYDLYVKPVARGSNSQDLIPLVRCQAPAFEVKPMPAISPDLE